MNKKIFAIFLIYCSLSFCQKIDNLDPSSFENRLFPFKFIPDTSFGLVINLRYFPSLTYDPQMIIIEYDNNKSFKVTYYWVTYSYRCASYEEILNEPESYRDFDEFTNKECPFYSNYIKDIYQMMLPTKLESKMKIPIHGKKYDLLIDSFSDTIFITRHFLDKRSQKKMDKIFEEASKCLGRKYTKKN